MNYSFARSTCSSNISPGLLVFNVPTPVIILLPIMLGLAKQLPNDHANINNVNSLSITPSWNKQRGRLSGSET